MISTNRILLDLTPDFSMISQNQQQYEISPSALLPEPLHQPGALRATEIAKYGRTLCDAQGSRGPHGHQGKAQTPKHMHFTHKKQAQGPHHLLEGFQMHS